ncbi:MAG: cation:proton antiporter subunit C [Chloroflexota bacterium]|nr:cation:proton antiporter subunit C [Chloroflexota bacterium]MDE2885822.1 cation:proton antiporter subunit C [Chloroflexota bacterium]
MIEEISARFPYWAIAVLLVVGLYGMMGKRSLVKQVIGLSIFQSAIILFFISGSLLEGATIPILYSVHGEGHANPDDFVNPLPHVLMLTAIVVGVAIIGVALSFLVSIYREFGTLDERELLDDVRE